MNIYKLTKLAVGNKTPRAAKLLGLLTLQICRKRYLGVFLDPVLACNLRCRMCYFSDEERRKSMRGIIDNIRLDKIQQKLFKYALKLQIGCGAEPTLYNGLHQLITRAKLAKIPYVSLVSNGQLLAQHIDLMKLVSAGLNELTLSMHGTCRETYEYLMPGAEFNNLLKLTQNLKNIKTKFPDFKIRVNFTVNTMNLHDLEGDNFWRIWPTDLKPDIVQIRPVQDIGGKGWTDYDLTPIKYDFDKTIGNVTSQCERRGITCIAPTIEQIDEVTKEQDELSSLIEDITYCYVSPDSAYKDDFDIDRDTLSSYHQRHRTSRKLLFAAFRRGKSRSRDASKKLNYTIK